MGVSLGNADPSLLDAGLAGEEGAVKVTVTPLTSHDMIKEDELQAKIMLPVEWQRSASLVERQQVVRFSRQPTDQVSPKGRTHGALKILKG